MIMKPGTDNGVSSGNQDAWSSLSEQLYPELSISRPCCLLQVCLSLCSKEQACCICTVCCQLHCSWRGCCAEGSPAPALQRLFSWAEGRAPLMIGLFIMAPVALRPAAL